MMGVSTAEAMTGETVELLQAMIRNRCVNDGTAESGEETRNADLLRSFLGTSGLELEQFEPTPGRGSLVARIEGSDPNAPSLCLMGHTDVVPVNESGWSAIRLAASWWMERCGAGELSTCSTSPHRWRSPSAISPRRASGRAAT